MTGLKFSHKQSLMTGLFLVLSLFCFSQIKYPKDTTITLTVPAQTFTVTVPIMYVFIPCVDSVKPENDLRWSSYTGTFQQFIDTAIKLNRTAVIDRNLIPASTITIRGNITLKADSGVLITNTHARLFHLFPGRQVFIGLNIVQQGTAGVAFFREPLTGTTFYDSLHHVTVTGGSDAYISSRGGIPNAMAVTAMRNCRFDNNSICVSVFSQDGPDRALHLKNVQTKSKISHNYYIHPAVSLQFDSVASISAGKLFMHQYSSTGNGGYRTSYYSRFKRVYCNNEAFEMTSVKNGYVIIDSSEIAPYVTQGVPAAKVWATRTLFYNAGNGITLAGTLNECYGGVWSPPNDTLMLVGGMYGELSMRGGGTIIADGVTVTYMSVADRGNNFSATFVRSIINSLYDERKGDGVIYLKNTPAPGLYFGQPYRKEIIQQLTK
jgi:hypothetical protein